jgi:hypothetical protein
MPDPKVHGWGGLVSCVQHMYADHFACTTGTLWHDGRVIITPWHCCWMGDLPALRAEKPGVYSGSPQVIG